MMMLRNRATSQRIIPNKSIARCRWLRGDNLGGLAVCVEKWICRKSSSIPRSASAHQWFQNSIFAADDDSMLAFPYRGNQRCQLLSPRYLSSLAAPDLAFGENSDPLPDLNLDDGTARGSIVNFRNDKPIKNSPSLEINTGIQAVKHAGKSDKVNAIPKQSTRAARIVFQSIAPHVENRTLHQLTKQLAKMMSRGQNHLLDTNTRSGKKVTLKRRLDQLFDKRSDGRQYSWSVKSHVWIETILYQFFMGKFIDDPIAARSGTSDSMKRATAVSKSLAYLSDSTYPPTRNRAHFQKNVTTLIKAREMALQYPIFWNERCMRDSGYFIKAGKIERKKNVKPNKKKDNKPSSSDEAQRIHAEKKQSQLILEAEVILEVLMHKLPQPHFERLMKELGKFAEVDGDLAEQKRESWYIGDEDDNSDSKGKGGKPNRVKPLKEIATKEKKQNQITILGTALHRISPSHSHLVAVELGRYLYVEVPIKSGDGEDEKSIPPIASADAKEELTIDAITIHPKDALFAIRKHNKLTDVEKKYQKLQDNFVQKMLHLQHEFASWEDTVEDLGDLKEDVDECSDDLTADLKVKEFQREQMGYKADARKHQEEALAETLLELRKMGLRRDESVQKRRGRPSKGVHLRFTAVKIETDSDSSPSEHIEKESDLEQRLVFINNLPIDTTKEEIDQIYSRCGLLDSIQLFNLRPDLDPGPLSKKQREDLRRKQRVNNSEANASYNSQIPRRRPRTPVYGILKFQTAEGFNLATCPEMSLFGCVIRRHPVMSIKPAQMKTLYLENITQSLLSIELEYKLARLLHPHSMHVMQDGMRGVGNGGQNGNVEYSEPSSCEVKFEDFQAANEAYDWMIGNGAVGEKPNASFMDGNDCEVHWFRTPDDKMRYWTRELNF